MRGSTQGFGSRLGVNFGFNSGNSNFFRWEINARADYRSENFYSFLVGNLERGTANEALFLFRGFAHYRFIWQRDSLFQPECFAQREFNEFILLNDRKLLGAGLRLNVLSALPSDSAMAFKLALGVGAMWENEVFSEGNPETKLLRSTNYLAFLWKFTPRTSMQLTAYYQVDARRSSDYRALLEGTLAVAITQNVATTVTLAYRYDNEPPRNVARYDLDVRNGFLFNF